MKPEQMQKIKKHGEDLLKIFPDAIEQNPVKLCKRLHRIENKVNRAATDYCNGDIMAEAWEASSSRALAAVEKLLNPGAVRIVINGDPRGYALKIDDECMRTHDIKLHRDWGGYGILAPEID